MSDRLITIDDVRAAARAIHGKIENTPFLHSQTLSELTGADIWLKFENLQFTGSFKQRGALNKLLSLLPEQRAKGVITVSAGNHAQGVAYHAGQLGIPATIVMPVSTPSVKAQRTAKLGAEVLLIGASFAEASAEIPRLIAARGLTLVHPFDDDLVMAGQGTVALEMLGARSDLDTLVVAVGGGGLIAGVATVARALHPGLEVIGVQSDRFPSMAKHIGKWDKEVPGGASIAEGIAVAVPGERTRRHVAALIDDIIVVPEHRIETAIALLLQIEKTLCEGAGAAGLAAVLADPERFRGKRVGLILCGGNIDNRLLGAILQRQMVRDERLFKLCIQLADQQGQLGVLCTEIGLAGGNINTVVHDRTFLVNDAKSARVELEVEVADPAMRAVIEARLAALGFILE
ncbi:MAG: threonine ammonia-lyase [Sphingomonas sp. 28-62-20]|uniref:threonine ammonia-lyase n=1 Tax=Sphingomonas sp. 28-62-20 TaxID=1970433 RepID=UPI000BC8A052|nr:MAG: threonine ammonia-lyase [Sphingomonas sp. 28-62-20]